MDYSCGFVSNSGKAETLCLENNIGLNNSIYYMRPKYQISKEFIKKEYFENNKSQDEIAKMLGVSQWVISQRMMEFGLEPKDNTRKLGQRTYSVDDNFFDELNPTNAWVLGWLTSDGFVGGQEYSSCFGIKVAKKDSDIICKLTKLLNFNGNIHTIKSKLKQTGKEYEQVWTTVSSKKIVQKLSEFGIVKNKSLTISFPKQIEKSNEEITRAFVLGVFEGDGSILFDAKQKSSCFQIVGTKELLEGIQLQLIKYLNLEKTKLTKNTKLSNHYALRYRGRFQAMKIFDWLYFNPQNFLNRKYNKYLEVKGRLTI